MVFVFFFCFSSFIVASCNKRGLQQCLQSEKKTALFYSIQWTRFSLNEGRPSEITASYTMLEGSWHQMFQVRIQDTKVGRTFGCDNTSQTSYNVFKSKEVEVQQTSDLQLLMILHTELNYFWGSDTCSQQRSN